MFHLEISEHGRKMQQSRLAPNQNVGLASYRLQLYLDLIGK